MHSATKKIAMVANTYASHVPLPASAHTSGIVAAGVVVGAIVETDCARVSMGDRIPRRKPKSAVGERSGGVDSLCGEIFSSATKFGGRLYNSCPDFLNL